MSGSSSGQRHGRRSRLRAAKVLLVLSALLILSGLLALCVWVSRPCEAPLEGIPFSTCIVDRDMRILRLGRAADGQYRLPASLDMLPREAVAAVLQYEDRYFWYHPGVNVLSLVRAGLGMLTGGRRMGGSTLTMQVVRLKYGLRTGSLTDKLRQMLLALRLEWHYDKKDILEAYFSLAPYGGNVQGLAAAARIYFHKEPAKLSLTEILSLIPVPQNPVLRTPSQTNPHFLAAAARLQRDYAAQQDVPVRIPLTQAGLRVFTPASLPMEACHVASELLQEREGTVRTTLSLPLQHLVEQHLAAWGTRLAAWGGGNAAALLVHWPSREILALAGSASFFNNKISGQIDMTTARRSPGSTLKPCIYALALEQGRIHPKTLLSDMPRNFAGYEPENFDGAFQGPLPADLALRLSRNVPAIALANDLAAPGLYGFLQRAGVRFAFPEEHYGLSLVLGGAEVTARELAALYAMLADKGVYRPLQLTLTPAGTPEPSAQGAQGGQDGQAAQPRRLLSPEAAFVTMAMLTDDNPDHQLRSSNGTLPLRLKTGTSNGLRDAWTCGVFGPWVLIVWVGNADNSSNPLFVGARSALPLFRELARAIVAKEPVQDMHATPSPDLAVRKIQVCSATGDVDTSLCPDQSEQSTTWFLPGVSPVRATGILRRVRINARTGNLLCPEELAGGSAGSTVESAEIIAQFWPSELRELYARAGITKPDPPLYGPACRKQRLQGQAPRIQLPKEGLTYQVRGSAAACPLVFQGHADAGVHSLYWFCGTDLVAVTQPGEKTLVSLPAGEYVLRLVDESGRSVSRRLVIGRMP